MRTSFTILGISSVLLPMVLGAQTIRWNLIGKPKNRQVSMVAVSSSGTIYAPTDSGMYLSSNGGSSWSEVDSGLRETPSVPPFNNILIASNGTIYLGTGGVSLSQGAVVYFCKLFRSTNQGSSWTEDTLGVPDPTATLVTALGEGKNSLILSGVFMYGIFTRSSGSSNWSNVFSGGTANPALVQSFTRTSMGTILSAAGTLNQHQLVIRSTDNGSTWTKSDTGLGTTAPYCLVSGASGLVFAGAGSQIFRSTDDGRHWKSVSYGLTSGAWVKSMAFSRDSGTVFAASTNRGVFKMSSTDTAWTPADSGLTDQGVSRIALGPDGRLYAATATGIFVTTSSLTVVELSKSIQPSEFGLSYNYPNPFNPSTRIAFEVPVRSHIRNEAFNMLGSSVAKLVDSEKSEGRYTVVFDGAKLASGMYVRRMTATSTGGSNRPARFESSINLMLLK